LGLGQVAVGHGASFRLAGQKVIILCFLTLLFLGCCTSYLKPPIYGTFPTWILDSLLLIK
jgi:hypothetical protein